jgi:hypothetical protein
MRVLSLLLSVQNLATYLTGRIAPDERVVYFPTSATQCNSTHWRVPIHGWIFKPKEADSKRAAFRGLLRRALQVPSGSDEERILHHRLRPFVVDNERWKRPKVSLAGREHRMSPSRKDGHFTSTLVVSEEEMRAFIVDSGAEDDEEMEEGRDGNSKIRTISFYSTSSSLGRGGGGTTDRRAGDEGTHKGVAMLVPPRGITVVSDVDDTIKVTDVVNKNEMLRNTFLREFVAVPGMADLYRRWCTTGMGDSSRDGPCHLHLLSASLYQLYEDLEAFRKKSGFPSASYTLKTIRPKDARRTIQTLLEDAYDFKRRELVRLLGEHPQRLFVLVGDTGEKDPHVYASMARDYPHQVRKVLLRCVPRNETDDVQSRVHDIMVEAGVARERWMVFVDASELNNVTVT